MTGANWGLKVACCFVYSTAQTILELSKNSRFTQNQRTRQQKLDKRIEEILEIERKNPWGRREKEIVDKIEREIEKIRDLT